MAHVSLKPILKSTTSHSRRNFQFTIDRVMIDQQTLGRIDVIKGHRPLITKPYPYEKPS